MYTCQYYDGGKIEVYFTIFTKKKKLDSPNSLMIHMKS